MLKIYSNFIPSEEFQSVIGDSLKYKPITVFNDFTQVNYDLLSFNNYNVLMVMEPNQLFGIHDWAIQNSHLFDLILTWGEDILDKCDNAYFFPFGISWLDQKFIDNVDNIEKRFEVSFLCGGKKRIEGHHLRHRLHSRENEISIPKQWYYTLPDYQYDNGNHTITQYEGKPPGFEKQKLWESMFSICVENSSNKGYHTEKIIDAFLSKTVPIYWGCPNLEELGYDPNGFFYCVNEDEIIKVVNSLTPEVYASKKEAIEHNFKIAQYYANLSSRFKTQIEEIVEFNAIEDKVTDYPSLFKKYKFNHNTFVETGTHHGDGVRRALDLGFNKVISVEILEDLYKECEQKFSSEITQDKVKLFLGDSNELLPTMLELLTEPSLVFLDGHFNNGLPLWGELDILKSHPIKEHTIIVDDFQNYFGSTEKELKESIKEINPDYKFAFEDSYNPGTGNMHMKHNLIAYLD
jgi:hypothetical protein